uniref:Uncharacterized protein n=1 Tax=Cannabis sativa TaxID=3483 RepID=A0A803PIX1_CANSA
MPGPGSGFGTGIEFGAGVRCRDVETASHVVVFYPLLEMVWRELGIGSLQWFFCGCGLIKCLYLWWCSFSFGGPNFLSYECIREFFGCCEKRFMVHGDGGGEFGVGHTVGRVDMWVKSAVGEFSLSIDASVVVGREFMGLGGVIRDGNGVVWASWVIGMPGKFSIDVAELLEVRLGLQ